MSDPILAIGAAGLEVSDARVQSLMNNVANAQTPGFKRSEVVVKSFPQYLSEAQNTNLHTMLPEVAGTYYQQGQASLVPTGKNTDVALGTDGYFVVGIQEGEGLTRDGRFYVDRDGKMLTVAGNYPVMGRSGPITINPGSTIEMTQIGEVKADSIIVDRLRVVGIQSSQDLEPVTGSLFRVKIGSNAVELDTPRVIQGYVESSNVSPIDSTLELVMLQKSYELNAKVIQARDAALSRALEIGRTQ